MKTKEMLQPIEESNTEEKAVTPAKARHRRKVTDLYLMIDKPKKTPLTVPCRWSPTGWKYSDVDPNQTKFFSNPNRLHNMNYYSPHRYAHPPLNLQQTEDSQPVSRNSPVMKDFKEYNSFSSTTYGAFF